MATTASSNRNEWSAATSEDDYAPLFLGTRPREAKAVMPTVIPSLEPHLVSTSIDSSPSECFSEDSSSTSTATSADYAQGSSTFFGGSSKVSISSVSFPESSLCV